MTSPFTARPELLDADPRTATGRPVRWGVVATGAIAATVTADLALLPDAVLQAVSSRRADRAAAFAERHGLPGRAFEPPVGSSRPHQARELVEDAVEAVVDADYMLSDLQDSMMPVEVGDPELRAGLAEVRELIGGLESRAGAFLSTLGR